jgi:hypothetical protein
MNRQFNDLKVTRTQPHVEDCNACYGERPTLISQLEYSKIALISRSHAMGGKSQILVITFTPMSSQCKQDDTDLARDSVNAVIRSNISQT